MPEYRGTGWYRTQNGRIVNELGQSHPGPRWGKIGSLPHEILEQQRYIEWSLSRPSFEDHQESKPSDLDIILKSLNLE